MKRMTRAPYGGLAALALAGLVTVAPARPVHETPGREPRVADRAVPVAEAPLRIDAEVVIAAAPARVWAALTTEEGVAGWIASESRIELRIGGPYELYFTPKEPDRGMEGTRVLAFVPGEVLSYTGEAEGTWVVWRLDETAGGGTRVRFTGLGTGEEWRARKDYFEGVMPAVLADLRAFAEGSGEPRG